MNNLYNLKLHERLIIRDKSNKDYSELHPVILWIVTRVPGGWVYVDGTSPYNIIFVPYNKEFEG